MASNKAQQKNTSHAPQPVQHDTLVWAYREMIRTRLIDEKTIVLYKQNKCHFQISGTGHEAVQVAAASVLRAGHDWFYPYYRDMALCAALGMTSEELLMNAINKEGDPNSHGRMMPMHYGHKALNIVPQSSPTGSQFLQAVGCALGCKLEKKNQAVYVSAGEGACSQGDFHEAMNWAARERLPVIFLVENNEYAISVHVSEQLPSSKVADIARGYKGFTILEIDGTDFESSLSAFTEARRLCVSGKGPVFIEAKVPRLLSHSISDNHLKYRDEKDIEKEQKRCPIKRLELEILRRNILKAHELEKIRSHIKEEIDRASENAEAAPDCLPETALLHNVVNDKPWEAVTEREPTGAENFLVDALNHALDEELAHNDRVLIYGEDVAHGKGGVFGVTSGLTAKYGKDRVFNSQLAESAIVGSAIGLATRGFKPVVEIQFGDYVWPGMNQIRNELAMLHYRSAGDFSCPAVIRIPVGGYIHGGAYHSQNIEATFAHYPGLYVVYPSNASDAKGLLKAAIRGDDPVLFLEHKGLYRQVFAKTPEGDSEHLVPLGKAKIVAHGDDATIVTWGALVQRSLEARKELENQGFQIEVIDLRSIVPLDMETIVTSVKKTGRLLIAHEDMVFMGFGSEIAAQVSESCFASLDAPIMRCGMQYAACVPHAPQLEKVVLPQMQDVLSKAKELLSF